MKKSLRYLILMMFALGLIPGMGIKAWAAYPNFDGNNLTVNFSDNKMIIDFLCIDKDGDDECVDWIEIKDEDGNVLLKIEHLEDYSGREKEFNFGYTIGYLKRSSKYYFYPQNTWKSNRSGLDWNNVSVSQSGSAQLRMIIKIPISFIPANYRGGMMPLTFKVCWKEYDTDGVNEVKTSVRSEVTKYVPIGTVTRVAQDPYFEKDENFSVTTDLVHNYLKVSFRLVNTTGADKCLNKFELYNGDAKLFCINHAPSSYASDGSTLIDKKKAVYNPYPIGYAKDALYFKRTDVVPLSDWRSKWKFYDLQKKDDGWWAIHYINLSDLPDSYQGEHLNLTAKVNWKEYNCDWASNEKIYCNTEAGYLVNIPDIKAYKEKKDDNFTVRYDQEDNSLEVKFLESNIYGGKAWAGEGDHPDNEDGFEERAPSCLKNGSLELGGQEVLSYTGSIITSEQLSAWKAEGTFLRKEVRNHRTYYIFKIKKIESSWWGKQVTCELKGDWDLHSDAGGYALSNVVTNVDIPELKNVVSDLEKSWDCSTSVKNLGITWNWDYVAGALDYKIKIYKGGVEVKTINSETTSSYNEPSFTFEDQTSINYKFIFGIKLNEYSPYYEIEKNITVDNTFKTDIWPAQDPLIISKGAFRDKITLEWTANPSETISYHIERKKVNQADDQYKEVESVENTKWDDRECEPGVFYKYRIFGENKCSDQTDAVEALGFRQNMAFVSGNISFKGNFPEKGVQVKVQKEKESIPYALSCNGTSRAGKVTLNKELFTNNAFSLGVWIYPQEGNGDECVLRKGATDPDMEMRFEAGKPVFNLKAGGKDYPLEGDKIETNTFTHLYVTYDGNLIRLYENGHKTDSVVATGSVIWNDSPLELAPSFLGSLDEITLWNRPLAGNEVACDYSRYLSGNEDGLIAYYPFHEGVMGEDAKIIKEFYDYSHDGSNYYNQHGTLENGSFTTKGPNSDQLRYAGVTDQHGNYSFTIPVTGMGEMITIYPSLDGHDFIPNSKLLYISETSPVHNGVDFEDISSFTFKGRVLYSLDDLYTPEATTEQSTEQGYNCYFSIQGYSLPQGEYTMHNGELKRYPFPVAVTGAQVKIDGQLVMGEDQKPILTNENGLFDIQVPIGKHYITVEKMGHVFTHSGQYPAPIEGNNYPKKDFNEDYTENVIFLDTTRVTVIGRAVGGVVEKDKKLGFGVDPIHLSHGHQTSENNIGQATITFQLGDNDKLTLDKITNIQTGEYGVDLLPENFKVTKVALTAPNAKQVSFPELTGGSISLDLSDFMPVTTKIDTIRDSEDIDKYIDTVKYHKIQNFIYRSVPRIEVTPRDIVFGEPYLVVPVTPERDTVLLCENLNYPIYRFGHDYKLNMSIYEPYTNADDPNDTKESLVPVTDGTVVIDNGLALTSANQHREIPVSEQQFSYSFRAGFPNYNAPFTCDMDIQLRLSDGSMVKYEGPGRKGIILGTTPVEGADFVTAGPETVTMVLRDPPGSNSYVYISKESSFSTETSYSMTDETGSASSINISSGVTTEVGGGAAGPVVKTEVVKEGELGLSTQVSSTDGSSVTKTYTLTETWQTSDDPDYVGSGGDLFVGEGKNFQLGVAKSLKLTCGNISSEPDGGDVSTRMTVVQNGEATSFFITPQKALSVNEMGPTGFSYSANFIQESLIPKYQSFVDGTQQMPNDTLRDKEWYQKQIDIWETYLESNERSKIMANANDSDLGARYAFNEDLKLKKHKTNIIHNVINSILSLGVASTIGQVAMGYVDNKAKRLDDKMAELTTVKSKNISFDSGLGEYSSESSISKGVGNSLEYSLTLSKELQGHFGYKVNDVGLVINTNQSWDTGYSSSSSSEKEESLTVGYVLKDGDTGDYFSVNVAEAFDGNGPVFSLKGGQSKCPWEGAEVTQFYKPGTPLGSATLKREVPQIRVEGKKTATLEGVPYNIPASFSLELINNSESQEDMWYQLEMDENTNPNGAIVKIDGNNPNRMLLVKGGSPMTKTLTIEKGAGDVDMYEDIAIILHSACDFEGADGDVADTVRVSVTFQADCSQVSLIQPGSLGC